jgi:hypothetical protein
MAIPNRWAVREAAEATFYPVGSNTPHVTLKTLKMTEVTTTGETTYAMGGRGNAKLVGFSGNREARVTIQDAIFDNKALAMLTGNEIKPAQKRDRVFSEEIVATEGQFTLSDLAFTGSVTYSVDGEEATGSATSGVVTVEDLPAGSRVTASWTKAVDSQAITVTASDFAGTYKLVLDVVVRDLETGKDFYGQFIAPKVQVENEFTFSFSPDGDPSVMDIPIEILKDTNSSLMYELVLYDNE